MLDAEIQVDSGIEEDEALCHFLSLNLAVSTPRECALIPALALHAQFHYCYC